MSFESITEGSDMGSFGLALISFLALGLATLGLALELDCLCLFSGSVPVDNMRFFHRRGVEVSIITFLMKTIIL